MWLLGTRIQVLTLHSKHFDHCVPILPPRPWKLHINVVLASEALARSAGSCIYPEAMLFSGGWRQLAMAGPGTLTCRSLVCLMILNRMSFPHHLSWMPCPARIVPDVITMVSLTAGHSDLTAGTGLFSISILGVGTRLCSRVLSRQRDLCLHLLQREVASIHCTN